MGSTYRQRQYQAGIKIDALPCPFCHHPVSGHRGFNPAECIAEGCECKVTGTGPSENWRRHEGE